MEKPSFSRRQLLGLLGTAGLSLAACQSYPKTLSKGLSQDSNEIMPTALQFGESKTGLAVSAETDAHSLAGHPENTARTHSILNQLAKAQSHGGIGPLSKVTAREATFDELARVHEPEYIRSVQRLITPGSYFSKSRWSPYGGPAAYRAAAMSAGITSELLLAIDQRKIRNGFALTRPPGHHATANQAYGYCIFNNIAVGVRNLQAQKRQKVAIVDFDVHHGNGIQDAFYRDADVLYISTHQDEWPFTGAIDKIGDGPGRGTTINIPLPINTGDRGLEQAYRDIVIPALRRFKPDMIVAAAGFDGHWRDYQGAFLLSLQGLSNISKSLMEAADELCSGKIAFVLEGGYQLEVLGAASTNLVQMLTGTATRLIDPFGTTDTAETDVSKVLRQVRRVHRI